ncbi:MAG: sugar kinase [Armatimonadota bacterium]|nr:sugar kinase [Armatimonadota bacterium]MDR7449374.1 sugar kinase [Armatimonadota bacterium]MDR7458341.1 sugar kinase [Armatimonadota bacterium]MDR7478854.1 sugar kinase [Armatimonadota bacterium]MDR7488740.1 sugar kinase [Armatimonadota bacterium]
MPDVVALGEPLVEFVALERGALGEVRTFLRGFGGDTANFAVAAARLGARAGYITRVGDDEFGRACQALWRQEGVDTRGVIVEPGGTTGIYFIALDRDGRHTFTYYRAGSAASRLRPADIDPAYLVEARCFHTSGITQAISEGARAAADEAMARARALGVTVTYDLNVRPRLHPVAELRDIVDAALRRAHIAFLSSEDAEYLFPGAPPETVMEQLLTCGPDLVVLKRGPLGCLVRTATGEVVDAPGWPVTPVDATGAGDAFDAAFVVERLRGRNLEEAARFANAVGALTTQGLGAIAALPTREAVEAFVHRREEEVAP